MSTAKKQLAPVITIDGPTASGKGTVSALVAKKLGWSTLDSGALYRLTALRCVLLGIDENDEQAVATEARQLQIRFDSDCIYLYDVEVSDALRQEHIGLLASKVASYPAVREALLQRQRDFREFPGLVGDGRDMGTVIFPDAALKIFLVADVHSRAERRYKQLIAKGKSANLSNLLADLQARDLRDTTREHAPLKAAADAITLDSTHLSIDQTVEQVLQLWAKRQNSLVS